MFMKTLLAMQWDTDPTHCFLSVFYIAYFLYYVSIH